MKRRGAGFVLLATFLGCSCSGGGGGNSTPAAQTAPPPTLPPAPPPSPPPPPPPTSANRAPVLSNPIPDQRGVGEHPMSYDFSQGGTTFTDPDGDTLTYSLIVYPRSSNVGFVTSSVSNAVISGTPTGGGQIEVQIRASDGFAYVDDAFELVIAPNSVPVATNPNLPVMTSPGLSLNYDATKGGSTFTDADGDRLTYQLSLLAPPQGLTIVGTNVVGALSGVGVVTFELIASDGYGGVGKNRFAIVVAAPEPGEPTLPATSFIYADAELPLPFLFSESSKNAVGGPFWDTQPPDNRTSNAGATLGRVLFYDRRLSITNTHACASCHEQATGFATSVRFDTGAQGVPMKRNSMALANVRYNVPERWFSDMRVGSLEELVLMPIEEPTELANFLPALATKLAATDFYPPLFEAAFGTPEIHPERIAKALAQFVRALISYRSRFDLAYSGNAIPETVLTAQELRGAELFKSSLVTGPRCGGCHVMDVQTMLGATSNGLDAVTTDPGVGGIGWFRAPSLRNIAVSAPYMHDGRLATLREVIDHYDHGVQDHHALDFRLREYSNGPVKRLNLSEEDKDALEAFMHTLTDDAFLNDPKFADPFL